ncbi:MAG: VWA domain-containing protein [Nocardioides sp.]|uniref:vWA domain-containing protein n=1 Tax=Nocardioides sp. TaxID=35761 RepID=UPI0039E35AE8
MPRSPRRTFHALRALKALVAALCTVAAVTALPPAPPSAAATTTTDDPGRLMLVLDASGSMAEPASGGGTKIDGAKRALGTVIDQLPADAPVGLRVYGSTVFSRTDPGACTDSERVVDIGTHNRDDLRTAVAGYHPYGETPIGYALQEAGRDLGTTGKRSIVLVSDGEPTCPPDPCEVARKLASQGIDLRIDVVGLDVGGKAADALRCIAKAGHGSYYGVGSAEGLIDALATLATRAVRPYEPTGEPVVGGTSATDAPTIRAGSYSDQLGGPGTVSGVRTYAVERSHPGSSLTLSASILTPTFADHAKADLWDGLQVELSGADGGSCASATPGTSRSMDRPFVVATVTDDACATDEQLLLSVTRDGGGQPFTTPLELVVTEELPVADATALPPAASGVAWVPPPGGKPVEETAGGTSFATATPLAPGVYRGTLVPNEIQVFSVDVGWGQQLAASMTIAKPAGKLAAALSQQGSPFSLDLFGPTRADARAVAATGSVPADTWSLYPTGGGTSGGTTAVVAYRNRESGDDALLASARAGSFPVVVSLIDDRATSSYEVPFVLRVGVSGEITGVPTYATPTPSPTPSETGTGGTTAPEDDARTTAATEPQGEGSDGGPPVALLAAGGIALLGLLGTGYALGRQRRRRGSGA